MRPRLVRRRTLRSISSCHRLTVSGEAAAAPAAKPLVNRSTTSANRSWPIAMTPLPAARLRASRRGFQYRTASPRRVKFLSRRGTPPGYLHGEHRAQLHREAHVALDLELAGHEEHLARLLAGKHVQPVLGRDR